MHNLLFFEGLRNFSFTGLGQLSKAPTNLPTFYCGLKYILLWEKNEKPYGCW